MLSQTFADPSDNERNERGDATVAGIGAVGSLFAARDVALRRRHPDIRWIFFINLFLGASGLGWPAGGASVVVSRVIQDVSAM
jgi:hypothetical protein